MTHNIFYRDFTLCKAAALVGLIGAALMLGGVPKADPDVAGALASSERVMPVVWRVLQSDCDQTQTGVSL
ncbi:hypothetical protein [Sagittula sp. S175]|uniref:hypothetical protein n=1 Tax=Sagittula sp. S175 TaxID=3415129 RepID=UPI003C7E9A44